MKLQFHEALLAVALFELLAEIGKTADREIADPAKNDDDIAARAVPIAAASARVDEAAKLFASPQAAIENAKAFLEDPANASEILALLAPLGMIMQGAGDLAAEGTA